MARLRLWQTSPVKHRLCLACKCSGLARGFCESPWLLGLEDTTVREEFTCPCPWFPKVQPEVEELEPTPGPGGSRVLEKNRTQDDLQYY